MQTSFPKRIISLVPSQTELLFDLGLNEEVVGITKFCIHPKEWFVTKQRVGGTKTVNIEKVKALQPDLVIANKEENVKEQAEALEKIVHVYVSDIANLEDAVQMIQEVGKLVGKEEKANEIVYNIQKGFESLSAASSGNSASTYRSKTSHSSATELATANDEMLTRIKTAYIIWKDPLMAAGGETFINDMMERCGLENTFENRRRYPEVSIEQSAVKSASQESPVIDPETCKLLLLSSEPYPFKQKHVEELQPRLPGTKIVLVDGEMFSWYGSRLLLAPDYFQKLITELCNGS